MNLPFTKTNVALAGLLVVQTVVLAIVGFSKEAPPTRSKEDAAVSGRAPFASLDLSKIRAIEAKKRDAEPVRLEKSTTKDGDKEVVSWTIVDRDGHPAKTSEVDRTVEALKKLVYSRVVTRRPTRYAALNVADESADARLKVIGDDGTVLADVFLGESKDYKSMHVRVAGDDAVYAASGAGLYDFAAEAQSLAETKLLDVELEAVVGFSATNETGTYEAELVVPESAPTSRPESIGSRRAKPRRSSTRTRSRRGFAASASVRSPNRSGATSNPNTGSTPRPLRSRFVLKTGRRSKRRSAPSGRIATTGTRSRPRSTAS
jgi:hypothetical protein